MDKIRYSKYKCYKCHKRGHIASQCQNVCSKCGIAHSEKFCIGQLSELIMELNYLNIEKSKEFKKDLHKKTPTEIMNNIERYNREIEAIQYNKQENQQIRKKIRELKNEYKKAGLNKNENKTIYDNVSKLATQIIKENNNKLHRPDIIKEIQIESNEQYQIVMNQKAPFNAEAHTPALRNETNSCSVQVPVIASGMSYSNINEMPALNVKPRRGGVVESAHKTEESSGKSGLLDVEYNKELNNFIVELTRNKCSDEIRKMEKALQQQLQHELKQVMLEARELTTKRIQEIKRENEEWRTARLQGRKAVINYKLSKNKFIQQSQTLKDKIKQSFGKVWSVVRGSNTLKTEEEKANNLIAQASNSFYHEKVLRQMEYCKNILKQIRDLLKIRKYQQANQVSQKLPTNIDDLTYTNLGNPSEIMQQEFTSENTSYKIMAVTDMINHIEQRITQEKAMIKHNMSGVFRA